MLVYTSLIYNLKLDSQETNTNHLKAFGFLADDFGSVDMSEKNLTWVTIKMQMILDRYPTWYYAHLLQYIILG